AMVTGKVSLVMRNPMDSVEGKASGTRFGGLAPMLTKIEDRERDRRKQREAEALAKQKVDNKRLADEQELRNLEMEKVRNENELAKARYENEMEKLRMQQQAAIAPIWETQILRGGVFESKTFPIKEGAR